MLFHRMSTVPRLLVFLQLLSVTIAFVFRRATKTPLFQIFMQDSHHEGRPWQQRVEDKIKGNNPKISEERRLNNVIKEDAECSCSITGDFIEPFLYNETLRITSSIQEHLVEFFYKYGTPKGPLHGLPVTLKDQFHIKRLQTFVAFVGWTGTFKEKKGTGKENSTESELI